MRHSHAIEQIFLYMWSHLNILKKNCSQMGEKSNPKVWLCDSVVLFFWYWNSHWKIQKSSDFLLQVPLWPLFWPVMVVVGRYSILIFERCSVTLRIVLKWSPIFQRLALTEEFSKLAAWQLRYTLAAGVPHGVTQHPSVENLYKRIKFGCFFF